MILRARTIVTMDGEPIGDGAVVVQEGRIAAVGGFAEIRRRFAGTGTGETHDLGEQVLLPGLINAHCHLDYTMMRGAIPPQKSFTQWVSKINALKRTFGEDDYLMAISEGFAELKRWGTTTVCNLAAFPELLSRLPPPPIRTWWFPELIDIRDPSAAEELLRAAVAHCREYHDSAAGPDRLGGFGLAPHAPYTASPELYQLCAALAASEEASQGGPLPLTTHIGESEDEEAMFRRRSGELSRFLEGIGRPMHDCGAGSSFSNAAGNGLIGPGWILAHANELEEADFELIAARPGAAEGGWHFVHCPRSHAFFGHRPFPWRRLRALGAGISLGTDSLASNDQLNLFAELRSAQKAVPGLTSEQLMETVTVQPARALRRSGELGVIAPGARADLIALPFAGPPHEVYDAILANLCPIQWMMLDGNRV